MIDIDLLVVFFLVFIRITAFMMTAPFFEYRNIPGLLKICFALLLAGVIFPVIKTSGLNVPGGVLGYSLIVMAEAGVGLMLGLIASFIFHGIRMAGQFIDFQLGFAMAMVYDPLSNIQTTIIAKFLNLLALIFFLNMNGHYYLIESLVKSYDLVPLTAVVFKSDTMFTVIKIFSGMFILAFQLSAPIIAVLVVVDLALGFVSRTVPQLNVFMMGFPMKIIVGILTLSAVVPALGTLLQDVFKTMQNNMLLLLRGLT